MLTVKVVSRSGCEHIYEASRVSADYEHRQIIIWQEGRAIPETINIDGSCYVMNDSGSTISRFIAPQPQVAARELAK